MASGFSSSLSGLSTAFVRQDVTADNLSNLNTSGFKSKRADQSSSPVGGAQIESVSTDTSQGPLIRTGRSQDVAIEGEGFFEVEKDGESFFTRTGSLDVDADGNLVNTVTGGIVQGFEDENSGGTPQPLRIGPSEKTVAAEATDSISFKGNLSTDLDVGDSTQVAVDVTDSQGTAQAVTLTVEKTDVNKFSFSAQDPETSTTALSGEVTFDGQGQLDQQTVDPSPNAPGSFEGLYLTGQGGDPIKVAGDDLDFSSVTQQANQTTLNVDRVSGRKPGQLEDVAVSQDGTVRGTFSNGERRSLGTLAVSTFSNASGLENAGGGLFSPTANSGQASSGIPGTGDRGRLRSGALEGSNVEMSRELTSMLVNEHTTEANVDALRVQDEMMGTLLDLTG